MRVRLSEEGVGDEAMKGLPVVRRLSAMRLPAEDAPSQGSRERVRRVRGVHGTDGRCGRGPGEVPSGTYDHN
ncbi:hypothetical protein GCM10010307_53330 [Streptomyces vastus]|uniref:Uncharacterized protein n=1 Tax=Streptomyces vastus TaxID=285451 RepID=A0ABN3R9K3_9ACTN